MLPLVSKTYQYATSWLPLSTSMLKPWPDCAGLYQEPVIAGEIANDDALETMARWTVVAWRRLPDVPVIVTVELPTAAAALAARVSVLLAEPFGAKLAVTPLGRPDAARLTLPVNPFVAAIAIVSVALAPCAMLRLVACATRLKSGT